MNFVEAAIGAYLAGFNICSCPEEHDGITHSCICVHRGQEFVGKLRWPNKNQKAHADESLIVAIECELKELNIPIPKIMETEDDSQN